MIRKFYEADDPFARSGGWRPPKPITGEDVAALLHGIHKHPEDLLHWSALNSLGSTTEDLFKDTGEVIFKESDLLPVLEALGLPAPVWGKSMSVEEFKKQRNQS